MSNILKFVLGKNKTALLGLYERLFSIYNLPTTLDKLNRLSMKEGH